MKICGFAWDFSRSQTATAEVTTLLPSSAEFCHYYPKSQKLQTSSVTWCHQSSNEMKRRFFRQNVLFEWSEGWASYSEVSFLFSRGFFFSGTLWSTGTHAGDILDVKSTAEDVDGKNCGNRPPRAGDTFWRLSPLYAEHPRFSPAEFTKENNDDDDVNAKNNGSSFLSHAGIIDRRAQVCRQFPKQPYDWNVAPILLTGAAAAATLLRFLQRWIIMAPD